MRREPPSPNVASRALVVAFAAHAALLGALVVMPVVRHATPVPADEPVAVELAEEPAELPRAEPRADDVADDPGLRVENDPNVERAAPRVSAAAAPRHVEESTAPTEPAPTANLVMPLPPAAIGLDLGGPNRFAGREAAAGPRGPSEAATPIGRPRTNEESRRAAEAALRAPARARDRELGLGPEGPVLAALGEATSASTAPVQGRAVFLAVTDGTGMIVGIDVVDCDGSRDGWNDAAALARAALKGKKLRLPSTSSGAQMRIEVTSAWKLPSGHDPGVDMTFFHVPVKKGEGKQSTKVAVLDPIPKLEVDELEIAPGVKIPVPSVRVDILAVQGDPADIAAKPRRIVHTKLLDSKVL